MSTDIMYFTFPPKNAQFFYEKSVILSGFWTARNIFFIVHFTTFTYKKNQKTRWAMAHPAYPLATALLGK